MRATAYGGSQAGNNSSMYNQFNEPSASLNNSLNVSPSKQQNSSIYQASLSGSLTGGAPGNFSNYNNYSGVGVGMDTAVMSEKSQRYIRYLKDQNVRLKEELDKERQNHQQSLRFSQSAMNNSGFSGSNKISNPPISQIQLHQIQVQYTTLQNEFDRFKTDVEAQQRDRLNQIEGLLKEKQRFISEKEKLLNDNKSLQTQLNEMKMSNKPQNNDFDNSTTSEGEYKGNEKQLNGEIEKLKAENTTIKAERDSAVAEKEKLQKQVKELQEEINKLKKSNQQQENESQQTIQKLHQQLQQTKTSDKVEKEKSRSKTESKTESKSKQSTKSSSKAPSTPSKTDHQSSKKRSKTPQRKSSPERQNKTIIELQTKLNVISQQLLEKTNVLDEVRAKSAEFKKSNEILSKENHDLTEKYQKTFNENNILSATIIRQKNELDARKKEITTLQIRQAKIKKLVKLVANIKHQNQNLSMKNRELEARVIEVQNTSLSPPASPRQVFSMTPTSSEPTGSGKNEKVINKLTEKIENLIQQVTIDSATKTQQIDDLGKKISHLSETHRSLSETVGHLQSQLVDTSLKEIDPSDLESSMSA